MEAIVLKTSIDDQVLAMGRAFEDAFESYLRKVGRADEMVCECESRLSAFRVPRGSPGWLRLRQQACGAAIEEAHEAATAVEAIAKQIRTTPVTTIAGLMVKAKCLPFEMSVAAKPDTPREDWDWDVECLYAFIDELERLAFGRVS